MIEAVDIQLIDKPRAARSGTIQTIQAPGDGIVRVIHWRQVQTATANGVEISRVELSAEAAISEGLALARAGLLALTQRKGEG